MYDYLWIIHVCGTHTQKKNLANLFVCFITSVSQHTNVLGTQAEKKLTAVHLPLLFLNVCYADTKIELPRQLLKVHTVFDAHQCLGNSTECEFTAPPTTTTLHHCFRSVWFRQMESLMWDSWGWERTNQRPYVSLNKAAAVHPKKWKAFLGALVLLCI